MRPSVGVPSNQTRTSPLMEGAALVLLVVLAGIAAWPAMHGQFIWDDLSFVRDQPLVNRADGLRAIWWSFAADDYWPLSYTLYWLERRWFGEVTFGYHAVALALHGLTAVAIWRCLRLLANLGLCSGGLAWLAAAVFVVHPVNIEVAAWIFQAKTSLCAALLFASLSFFLQAVKPGERRTAGFGVACMVLFALAMLAKSSAVLAPVWLMLALALVPRPMVAWRSAKVLVAGLTLTAAVIGGLSYWSKLLHADLSGVVRTGSWLSRCLIAAKAFWFYLGKAVWPLDLSVIYRRWSESTQDLAAWWPALLLLGLGGLVYAHRHRRIARLLAACLGYFGIMLLPCLGFVDISFMRYSLVADHWQYLAIIGVIVGLLLSVDGLLACTLPRLAKPVSVGMACVLVLGLTLLSRQRAFAFVSEEAMWRATLVQVPTAFLAHNNLGLIEQDHGNLRLAAEHYEQALRDGREQEANSGVLGGIAYNYAQVLAGLGQQAEALAQAEAASLWMPQFPQAHWLAGDLLRQRGDVAAAIRAYRVAKSQAPELLAIQMSLGEALRTSGQPDAALLELEPLVRQRPDDAGARQSLGLTYMVLGRLQEAAAQFRAAILAAPQSWSPRLNLGFTLVSLRAWDEATAVYREAVAVAPNQIEARLGLVKVLAQQGLKVQAFEELQRIERWDQREDLKDLRLLLQPEASAAPSR